MVERGYIHGGRMVEKGERVMELDATASGIGQGHRNEGIATAVYNKDAEGGEQCQEWEAASQ